MAQKIYITVGAASIGCIMHVSSSGCMQPQWSLSVDLSVSSQDLILQMYIRESQTCRSWKGPLEITKSNLPAKEGSLQYVAQKSV